MGLGSSLMGPSFSISGKENGILALPGAGSASTLPTLLLSF